MSDVFKIRNADRFDTLQDRFVIIKKDNDFLAKGVVENVSNSGICIRIESGDIDFNYINKALNILFVTNKMNSPVYQTKLVRQNEEKGWVGLEFTKKLDPRVVNEIRGINESFEIAKADKQAVLKESLQIKTCSSNYFVWTVGLLLPLISGIWTLFIQDKITPSACSGAMLSTFLLFCMSVFSNLEKSRAIYKREGFAAALDTYIINGIAPAKYKGWSNLKYSYAECTSRRDAKVCPRKLGSHSKEACKFIGEKKANINLYKKVIPSILDSFISLTSLFYAIIYLIITMGSCIAITKMLSSQTYNIESTTTVMILVFSYLIGFLVLGRKTNLLLTVCFFTIAIFVIDIAKPDISLTIKSFKIDSIFVKIIAGFVAYIFGSVGHILVSQLIRLRTKEYSFESQFYMWLNIFEHCDFLPDYEIVKAQPKNRINNFFESLFVTGWR